MVAAATVAYIGAMLLVVRPLLRRVIARWESEQLPRSAVAFVFVALLLSALATEAIGIHAIFGAFLLGAVIPAGSALPEPFASARIGGYGVVAAIFLCFHRHAHPNRLVVGP